LFHHGAGTVKMRAIPRPLRECNPLPRCMGMQVMGLRLVDGHRKPHIITRRKRLCNLQAVFDTPPAQAGRFSGYAQPTGSH
jgi:hypothetical protein